MVVDRDPQRQGERRHCRQPQPRGRRVSDRAPRRSGRRDLAVMARQKYWPHGDALALASRSRSRCPFISLFSVRGAAAAAPRRSLAGAVGVNLVTIPWSGRRSRRTRHGSYRSRRPSAGRGGAALAARPAPGPSDPAGHRGGRQHRLGARRLCPLWTDRLRFPTGALAQRGQHRPAPPCLSSTAVCTTAKIERRAWGGHGNAHNTVGQVARGEARQHRDPDARVDEGDRHRIVVRLDPEGGANPAAWAPRCVAPAPAAGRVVVDPLLAGERRELDRRLRPANGWVRAG